MKKILPILVILLAAVGIGYNFINKEHTSDTTTGSANNFPTVNPASNANGGMGEIPATPDSDVKLEGSDGDSSGVIDEVKPAAVAYKNAEEALAAIKKGAADYDDTILEQFTNPGEDCTFCTQVYADLKDLLSSTSARNEEKSFYAEILAISGRVDNVKTLVEGYKNGASTESRELYGAALELTTGKDDVVKYLGTELATDNPELKESIVAAMTNQGSSLAFDTLFKSIVSSKNVDGFYSMGVGPAEMILNEEGLAKAQEYAQKRDEYAPLAVKAMLNSGLPGIKSVIDIISASNDQAANDKLLANAVDHVGYDENVEKYFKEKANDSNPSVRKFAEAVLKDYATQEEAVDQEPVVDEAPMSKNQ